MKIMHTLTLSPILMKRIIDLIWRVAPGVQTEWLQCSTIDDALDALKRNRSDIIIAQLEPHSHDYVEYLHWFDDYQLVTGINDMPEAIKRAIRGGIWPTPMLDSLYCKLILSTRLYPPILPS